MNPGPPPSQPAYRPPPFQARSDRDVLSPNQRIVFFAAFLFLGVGSLVATVAVAYFTWSSDLQEWVTSDSRFRHDSPSLFKYFLGSILYVAAFGGPLLLVLAVLKDRLRRYMMERPVRS
ncbi:hypothetical protein [Nocardia asteroides]|uniref:hypothetical protein n=1 Tax=Nocardia asteroides TaxID=1824 RepID=UPI001E3FDA77|nr:hypothetical protein [Nocardia asteroides]UGT60884.1 hypothetical protein LTT61_27655 [Nocardia asteroides]